MRYEDWDNETLTIRLHSLRECHAVVLWVITNILEEAAVSEIRVEIHSSLNYAYYLIANPIFRVTYDEHANRN
jgi:hypothetical protein